MERVVPWAALVEPVAPYAPEGKKGRPPFAVKTLLRIHFMQQWSTRSCGGRSRTDPDAGISLTHGRALEIIARIGVEG
jgi:hypothetical protein